MERGRIMATILAFRHEHRVGAIRREGTGTAAEIVFFPGVRYERWDDAPPPPVKSKKRARRRDKIELND